MKLNKLSKWNNRTTAIVVGNIPNICIAVRNNIKPYVIRLKQFVRF